MAQAKARNTTIASRRQRQVAKILIPAIPTLIRSYYATVSAYGRASLKVDAFDIEIGRLPRAFLYSVLSTGEKRYAYSESDIDEWCNHQNVVCGGSKQRWEALRQSAKAELIADAKALRAAQKASGYGAAVKAMNAMYGKREKLLLTIIQSAPRKISDVAAVAMMLANIEKHGQHPRRPLYKWAKTLAARKAVRQ